MRVYQGGLQKLKMVYRVRANFVEDYLKIESYKNWGQKLCIATDPVFIEIAYLGVFCLCILV
jgi:hypothetical protein